MHSFFVLLFYYYFILQQIYTMKKSDGKGKFIVVLFLTAGIASTFAYKLQGSQLVDQGMHKNKPFFHPYIQSMTMFIAEALCLILYFAQGEKTKLALQQGKTPHKRYIFLIPACSDAFSSMLQYMGLSFISGSTYMMFKGASIVTTAIFSRILVKMVVEKRHLAGCGLAIAGLVVVGSSGFLSSNSSGQTTFQQELVGYVLMLISLIFNGFLYAYQQKLLKQHTIHPLEMVGFEGCFGICLLTIVLTILSFIPCDFGVKGCVFDQNSNPFMELPRVYLRQVFSSGLLVFLVISGILTIAVYNFGGVSITKMFDALTRSLLNVTKTAAIWIVGIIITLFATTKQYELESLSVGVNLVKAVGFSLIILGTLIYNKLIFRKYFEGGFEKKEVFIEQANSDSVLTSENLQTKK